MSLLLDARKKSQQAQSAQGADGSHSGLELSLEALPNTVHSNVTANSADQARIAGQNLFNAKSHVPTSAGTGNNRKLIIALIGAALLLTAGAGYVWYAIQPARPVAVIPASSLSKPLVATPPAQNMLVPDIVSPQAVSTKQSSPSRQIQSSHSTYAVQRTRKSNPVLVEQHQDESIFPVLSNAYRSYREGHFEQAQQLYGEALTLDANNTDALLGLAVISQRKGQDGVAANYYAKVLALDPRNAVANSGMSALSTDANRESRLKTLLNEQQGSSALHFALGNQYAGQTRWGDAQQEYFNAYRLDPENAELAFNLAVSLDRLGQNKTAAQYYQRALQLDKGQIAGFDHQQITKRIEDLTH
jgi:Flp pilus assembly protein TadD